MFYTSNLGYYWQEIKEKNLMLLSFALLGLFMANVLPFYYQALTSIVFENNFIGYYHNGYYSLTPLFVVNEMLMSLFFFTAGKEVMEAAILKNGILRGKSAKSIFIITLGGVVFPIIIYKLIAALLGMSQELSSGWAIPTATDIAFASMFAILIFGNKHPAVTFLLAIAILDDIIGMIIIAGFFPSHALHLEWLALSVIAAFTVYFIFNFLPVKKDQINGNKDYSHWIEKRFGLWPYIIAGIISWYGFFRAGIHPALGLLPIVPTLPHAEKDFGLFSPQEAGMKDMLNRAEHSLDDAIHFVLAAFGFLNTGVIIGVNSFNGATLAVIGALLLGKPLGVIIAGYFSSKTFGLPKGVEMKHMLVLGLLASIGFTVSLFMSVQAFEPGQLQDGARMGALLSFSGYFFAKYLAKFERIGLFVLSCKKNLTPDVGFSFL